MGKYADGLSEFKNAGQTNIEVGKFRMLQAIANELAEGNRLKRLELSLTKLPENSDKLEDKA